MPYDHTSPSPTKPLHHNFNGPSFKERIERTMDGNYRYLDIEFAPVGKEYAVYLDSGTVYVKDKIDAKKIIQKELAK